MYFVFCISCSYQAPVRDYLCMRLVIYILSLHVEICRSSCTVHIHHGNACKVDMEKLQRLGNCSYIVVTCKTFGIIALRVRWLSAWGILFTWFPMPNFSIQPSDWDWLLVWLAPFMFLPSVIYMIVYYWKMFIDYRNRLCWKIWVYFKTTIFSFGICPVLPKGGFKDAWAQSMTHTIWET